jgi:hypothetical protein
MDKEMLIRILETNLNMKIVGENDAEHALRTH